MRGLTTIFLVGGLAVEKQTRVSFEWGWVKEEVCRSKQRMGKWNNKFEAFLSLFLLTSQGKVQSLCQFAEVGGL